MLDTKLNQNKNKALAACILVLVLITAMIVACLPEFYRVGLQSTQNVFETDWFTTDLYRSGYVLYDELAKKQGNTDTIGLFLPNLTEVLKETSETDEEEDGPFLPEKSQMLKAAFSGMMTSWRWNFYDSFSGMEYYATDGMNTVGSNRPSDLLVQSLNGMDDESLKAVAETYQYFIMLSWDETGNASWQAIYGAEPSSLDQYPGYRREYLLNELRNRSAYWDETLERMVPHAPAGMKMAVGVPRNFVGYNLYLHSQQRYEQHAFSNAGFLGFCLFGMALTVLVGLFAGCRWRYIPKISGWLPLELVICLFVCLSGPMSDSAFTIFYMAGGGEAISIVLPYISFTSVVTTYALAAVTLLLWLTVGLLCTLSLCQIYTLSPGRYVREKIWIIRFLRWCGDTGKRYAGKVWAWVSDIDLTDRSDKAVLKILLVNFIILVVVCLLWFAGIFALIIYSVGLFFLLRKYAKDLKEKYRMLLYAIGRMAQGDLNVDIHEDLGVFTPLGKELVGVQTGFKKAVEAETKSQMMKTELVTNVSHDLKTPLTAMITYIELLKNEGITEEERRLYIGTLDKKSHRLKALIEDLFEMSKATSGNITLNRTDIDLPALLRQVQNEMADEIEASGVEFRYKFPAHPVTARLDGEKASRVFENLFINVTKYAMPGSRAYVELSLHDKTARVEVKNVSRSELDEVLAERMTDRFVRGDASRNTEGSGLGLAIAKSFTELLGGRLQIMIDGDLFKVIVEFPAKD